MAKDRPPSFQFYPRDFMADTGHLTDRQRSHYLLALCRSWLSGGYGVGTPEEWREWFGYADPAEYEADLPILKSLLWIAPCEPEGWVQKRMAAERGEQAMRYRSLINRPQNKSGGRPDSERDPTVNPPSPHREPTLKPQSSASAFASASKSDSKEEAAPPTKRQRRKAVPDLTLSPERIADACARFPHLHRQQVELVAARVVAEAPQRGYVNAYSALLNWLKREKPDPAMNGRKSTLWTQEAR